MPKRKCCLLLSFLKLGIVIWGFVSYLLKVAFFDSLRNFIIRTMFRYHFLH